MSPSRAKPELLSCSVLSWFWEVVERWLPGAPTYSNCKRGCRAPYTEVFASLLVCRPAGNIFVGLVQAYVDNSLGRVSVNVYKHADDLHS